MDQKLQSKDYSFRYCTADQVLCKGPCELTYFNVEPSAGAAEITLYNGTDGSGDKIIGIYLAVQLNYEYAPPVPLFLSKGLYLDIGDNVTGVLIQWRDQNGIAS